MYESTAPCRGRWYAWKALDYLIPFKQYKHEPSAPHNFKLIVISIDPVFNHSGKTAGKRVENVEEVRAYIKVCTLFFTELGKVCGPDKVSYERVLGGERNF